MSNWKRPSATHIRCHYCNWIYWPAPRDPPKFHVMHTDSNLNVIEAKMENVWWKVFRCNWPTCLHSVSVIRVQFSNLISVPFRRTVACICGQKPLVFVRHHSPHDAHKQYWFAIVILTVWHITGSTSKPDWNALQDGWFCWGDAMKRMKNSLSHTFFSVVAVACGCAAVVIWWRLCYKYCRRKKCLNACATRELLTQHIL